MLFKSTFVVLLTATLSIVHGFTEEGVYQEQDYVQEVVTRPPIPLQPSTTSPPILLHRPRPIPEPCRTYCSLTCRAMILEKSIDSACDTKWQCHDNRVCYRMNANCPTGYIESGFGRSNFDYRRCIELKTCKQLEKLHWLTNSVHEGITWI